MSVSNLIEKFLDKDVSSSLSVNVIGDSMMDEYYQVEVNRISPEFPIPVYKSVSADPSLGLIPGGAANVANQFVHFNVKVELISLLDSLSNCVYNECGINTNNSKIIQALCLPKKRRIYCENMPLVRWDIEKDNYGLDDIKKHLLDLEIPDSDFNIFSDYSKGVFAYPWFRKFIKKSPSIVDPKNSFIDFWEDCTVFKPNAHEAKVLSEKKQWKDQIEFFMDALRCEGVVITQSGNGVVGKQEDYFEIRPREILHRPESVIGAGDCFISFITMAMARGFTLEDASKIAFAAGTFYVQRKHNSPISPAELLSVGKIKFVKNPSILKKRNFKLVVTNGCFDILHAGHLQTFNFAKSKGDKLCVAINTDNSVSRIKGESRPVISLENRIKMIEALDVVDYVVCFDEDTPYDLYKNISPDVLIKGGDYDEKDVVGKDLVKELYICPLVEGVSTSKLVAKIKNI